LRLVTFTPRDSLEAQAGIVSGQSVVPFSDLGDFSNSLLEFIAEGPDAWQRLHEALKSYASESSIKLENVRLLAPIPRPRKNIVCLGWNYAAHADESARAIGKAVELPQHPVVFTKAPTSINGPYDDIIYDPALTTQLDWEVELGVVIGRAGKAIPVEKALDYVFGYTIINDISARDIQQRHKQFFLGKSLDGACPMGPWIVTREALKDPQRLTLRTYVNNELKQDGNTEDQIFSVAETISILSRGMTLEPGDIIATGTPDGVGFARMPPEYLSDGDVVTCEIDGIGKIENRVSTLQA